MYGFNGIFFPRFVLFSILVFDPHQEDRTPVASTSLKDSVICLK